MGGERRDGETTERGEGRGSKWLEKGELGSEWVLLRASRS